MRSVYASGSLDHRIHCYYNEDWQLLEERKEVSGTEDADPLNQYVWHPSYIDALAVRYYDASTSGSQVQHFYCQDANYNVTTVLDNSGTVLERYNYTPYGVVTFLDPDFGNDVNQISDIGNTHLYTGRERDAETGLQLNRHRYYASHLGRWLTRDPIGFRGRDYNLYAYGDGSPTNKTDPNGDCPPCILIAIGIGIGIGLAGCDGPKPTQPTTPNLPYNDPNLPCQGNANSCCTEAGDSHSQPNPGLFPPGTPGASAAQQRGCAGCNKGKSNFIDKCETCCDGLGGGIHVVGPCKAGCHQVAGHP